MASSQSVQGIVDSCGLFSAMDASGRARLAAMGHARRFKSGQQIIRQGDACPGVFVVGTGLVRIYKFSPAGKEHILHLAGAGNTFLEVAAILGKDCPAFAEALEPSECVLLPLRPFMLALQEQPAFARQLLGGMAQRVVHFVNLLEDVVLRDALSRVASHLLESAGPEGRRVRVPGLKKHLASHLNLTSETLSRCLRRLLDEKLIAAPNSATLELLDIGALREAAQGMYPKL